MTPSDPDRRFVKAAMAAPMLAADHELALAHRWRDAGDEDALHELTSAYMRLVIAMAGRFRRPGLPTVDLIQEGAVGLMQAAARFEPERGLRFSTYAAWWVRSCMQDYARRNGSIVRSAAPGADRSLNAPVGTEDAEGEWQDLLVCDRPSPEAEVMERRDAARRIDLLQQALETLKPRERAVIAERRLAETPATLEALGATFSISKERVRQIELAALAKLKRALAL